MWTSRKEKDIEKEFKANLTKHIKTDPSTMCQAWLVPGYQPTGRNTAEPDLKGHLPFETPRVSSSQTQDHYVDSPLSLEVWCLRFAGNLWTQLIVKHIQLCWILGSICSWPNNDLVSEKRDEEKVLMNLGKIQTMNLCR